MRMSRRGIAGMRFTDNEIDEIPLENVYSCVMQDVVVVREHGFRQLLFS